MVLERILVGFDGSPASERALAVALALRAPDGRVESLTVAETHYATHAGMDAAAWDAQLRAKAVGTRDAAAQLLGDVDFAVANIAAGYAANALLRNAANHDADLIVVGAHGHSRVAEVILGSVAARVVHEAPCSVLVARGDGPLEDFPKLVAVADEDSSCDELVDASRSADLVVIDGARGGLAERVARRAECSVLIARGWTGADTSPELRGAAA